jgi:lipopolysaccharide export system protein LptA
MTTRFLSSALVALAALMALSVAPISAHHSFAAEFDANKPVTIKGVVAQIDWKNPHVWFYVNVKEEDGRTTRWACEMGAPHQLQQRGWLRDTMKIGDEVTVEGSLARDGSKRANARTVTTADGKTLGAASSGDPTTRP